MSPFLRKCIGVITSMKIAVACFLVLAVITYLGTVYQVDHGLHAAEEVFFGSRGAGLVLAVLFVNMSAAMILLCFLPVKPGLPVARRVGVLLTHGGVLVLILGGAWIEWTEVEANLTLVEGEQGNVARMYGDWELAFWKEEGVENGYQKVIRVSQDAIESAAQKGEILTVPEVGVEVQVQT